VGIRMDIDSILTELQDDQRHYSGARFYAFCAYHEQHDVTLRMAAHDDKQEVYVAQCVRCGAIRMKDVENGGRRFAPEMWVAEREAGFGPLEYVGLAPAKPSRVWLSDGVARLSPRREPGTATQPDRFTPARPPLKRDIRGDEIEP